MKKHSNLACPKCQHIITAKDLKHWKCIKCKAEFKITLTKTNKSTWQLNKEAQEKMAKRITK